ncbi:MAG TPA: serine/threonine-protein kinase, partial [Solirubrobacteraceae bacterium]
MQRSGTRSRSAIEGHGRFAPGDLLADRYRIVALLGKGGMGEVYRADDLTLAQPVALKFLPPSLAQEHERLERFYNEVRVARQVSHPNVCRVYDVGAIEGEQYLSMEFVDGEDLASLLRRIGRLPADKALEIARQLCAGLAAAHDKGVLHRDLKPENVMLDGRGKVRITDFGLASLAEHVAGNDVRSGTPAYMSPEQLTGREVTVRSDVYALGLVLFELFTGKRAFEGKSFVELLRKHENDPPPSPCELVKDLDPRVEAAILRCLEKDPRRRPASALAVAAALPGGDPLAAALAAGETPSPEMVAASGQDAGLQARAAWSAAAFTLLGALAFAFVAGRELVLGIVPLPKPPVVLADQAREMIARIGYPDPPGDSAYAFSVDYDYIGWKSARDKSIGRWRDLRSGTPPVVQLWYRQSPQPLVSSAISGRVFWGNPAMLFSGMTGVRLDPRGNLLEFYAVPPQVDDAAVATAAPDWSRLFAEARLDETQFREVAPTWTPRSYADSRAAWEGPLPGRPDITIRIEAASHRGRPVWFELIAPWTRPARMEAFKPSSGQVVASTVASLLLVCGLVAGGVLALRNLRLGRVDRRAAATVTGFAVAVGM